MGSNCLTGAEFVWMMKRVLEMRGGRRWLHHNVNVPNAAELYTQKWLRQYILLCVLYHKI